jgi:hypothetical protein
MYLTGTKVRAISRALQIDRETVTRILSQEETRLLIQGYREAVLRIVPRALIGASELVDRLDRQMITDVLRGARVFIDRHEVAAVQEPERTYDSAKVAFYERFGHWPTHEEAVKFDKTIKRQPKVKGDIECSMLFLRDAARSAPAKPLGSRSASTSHPTSGLSTFNRKPSEERFSLT